MRILSLAVFAIIMAFAGYWAGAHPSVLTGAADKALALLPPALRPAFLARAEVGTSAAGAIYYRDPDGLPVWSLTAKTTPDGRPFLGVAASEDLNLNADPAQIDAAGAKKIRFYRNPMGLPDTSPVPKKDSMGMAYIAVYEGDGSEDGTLKISPGRVQRTGVQSQPATLHRFTTPVRAPATIQLDERRQSVVALRFDGWIEQVADVTTGTAIKEGQPLFRVYGAELSAAAAQYVSSLGSATGEAAKGARRRLENLGVPDTIIAAMALHREVPLALTWPAPRDGTVVERNVTAGMRAKAGDVLFKVADISTVWVLADIAERDLAQVRVGQSAIVRPRGAPDRSYSGLISVINPQINRETRTARVRIELPNPDDLLLPNMYADVEIATGSNTPMLAVPQSAVIDSGDRQVIIIDKGEGRFEPRAVKTGQRGEGLVEIRSGLAEGENIVTAANFLIDAESNLKAALQGLSATGEAK